MDAESNHSKTGSEAWHNVHPDFDGHRKPVSEMTDAEILQMAWEGTLLMRWAQQVRLEPPDHSRTRAP